MGIGVLLKKYRIEKGYSRKQMAEKLEMPYSTYANYENDNRTPSIAALTEIANALEMTVAELIGEKPPTGNSYPEDYRSFNATALGAGKTIEFISDIINTIAAHHEGEDWTDEELAEIEEFKRFVLSKRKAKE